MNILLCFLAYVGLVHISLFRWSLLLVVARSALSRLMHLCMLRHLTLDTYEPVMDILLCFVAHAGLVHIGLSHWSLVRGHGSVILSPSECLFGI